MSAHPHAENMRLYAEDAAETDDPAKRWECRPKGSHGPWTPISVGYPAWWPEYDYRRKPKPLELWVNIYSDGRRINHNDKKRAKSAADSDPTNSLLRAAVHMREVIE